MYSVWTLHGECVRDQIEKGVRADYLYEDLKSYQKVFGKEFGITELLKVHDIMAKGRIAEAICNAPEFFMDQLGKARNSTNFPSVSKELEVLNGHLERYLDNIE